ncbi:MAG: long-chain fatty acid--CoA ligase [Deltaproteobacteria bacterium]|nr:long-chain fatty acid--CoA ligase [Deltaproteobacteria bacterium]
MAPQNLLQLFAETVQTRSDSPCFRYKEEARWNTLNWNEVFKKVLTLAGALKKLGVKKGDRVSIFAQTRYEWTLADLAILSCGAVTVPIYQSNLPDQAAYIIENAGARLIFAEDAAQLKKIDQVRHELPLLSQIILFDDGETARKQEGIYSLEEVMLLGTEEEGRKIFEEMRDGLDGEADASFVYTSGTTGPPKGAVLTHRNFLAELTALDAVFDFEPHHESLIFLPLAHILARVVQFAQLQRGFIQCYAESIDKLLDDVRDVGPHLMASVPRIFEKIHTRVMQGVETSSDAKKKIFQWALNVGHERARLMTAKKRLPLILRLKWEAAFRLVFAKLHHKLGGRIKFFISGGAPLSVEIGDFFHAAGFIILEGYGLTETTAAITCNTLKDLKIGTVGKPLEGVEIKIAEDGEILARGDVVFKGYYRRPEETAEALNSGGWFHTGDIGVIDAEGFLKITDRKKDIIVTAAGKNIAPQNIEGLLKTDPLISQVMVHGDRRKYLSALITLDKNEVIQYAKSNRISFQDYADLVENEKIYDLIKQRIEEKNRHLARYESIKKFAILKDDFSVETGELTPTLKVKRKFTSEKYKEVLDSLYQD